MDSGDEAGGLGMTALKIRERVLVVKAGDDTRSRMTTFQVVGPRGVVLGNYDLRQQAERAIAKATGGQS
jgi:hypothetical protein